MSLKSGLVALAMLTVAACSLMPDWQWERPGATDADYRFDETECKSRAYSGTDGMVTQARVRHMQDCMIGKGWRKVPR